MTKNVGRCQIVDGLKSIKMIRSFEDTHPGIGLSDCAACNGRVPVFAVSESLVEKDRQLYVDGSFDGWILKPIDFKRPSTLLVGIVNEDIRGLLSLRTWGMGTRRVVYAASIKYFLCFEGTIGPSTEFNETSRILSPVG